MGQRLGTLSRPRHSLLRRPCPARWSGFKPSPSEVFRNIVMPLLVAASLRSLLWNVPPLYAVGGMLVLITVIGLWAAARW